MKDKYDRAIEHLTAYPDGIQEAWSHPSPLGPGCLFQYAGDGGDAYCGCLTQIRGGLYEAATGQLTIDIANDNRIPMRQEDITVESLPVFAEWQRKLDHILGRK